MNLLDTIIIVILKVTGTIFVVGSMYMFMKLLHIFYESEIKDKK